MSLVSIPYIPPACDRHTSLETVGGLLAGEWGHDAGDLDASVHIAGSVVGEHRTNGTVERNPPPPQLRIVSRQAGWRSNEPFDSLRCLPGRRSHGGIAGKQNPALLLPYNAMCPAVWPGK